jgi:hypothetical protein
MEIANTFAWLCLGVVVVVPWFVGVLTLIGVFLAGIDAKSERTKAP